MIYFITNRTDHGAFIYKSKKIQIKFGYEELSQFLKTTRELGYDSEGTGNRLFKSELLLIQIGNKDTQFVLDCTNGQYTKHISFLNKAIQPNWHILFGHNLKYDRNLAYPFGLELTNLFDTMISEQSLVMGSGLPVNIVDTCSRRLQKLMDTDKETRKDFIYMTNKNATFDIRHIMYAAGDVVDVIDIAIKQKEALVRNNQYGYVRNIEHKLVEVLSTMELTGVPHSKEEWRAILTEKRQEKYHVELKLDEQVAVLSRTKDKNLAYGIYTNKRKKGLTTQLGMFGHDIELENVNKGNINYNSSAFILDWIARLGYKIPTTSTREGDKESMAEEAIQTYLLENPHSDLSTFFKLLLEYKGLQKFISSYGPKYLTDLVVKADGKSSNFGYRIPITDRVHTSYKQCFTDTGRLSSGDGKSGYFNSQQLPQEKRVREAFRLTQQEIDDGWFISTYDLSGAEAIIMAALSNEYKLYDLAVIKDDVHSPIATKCWQAIYRYRQRILEVYKKCKILADDFRKYNVVTDLAGFSSILDLIQAVSKFEATYQDLDKFYNIYDSKKHIYELSEGFIVDKNNNKQLRTDFKPYTFGTFYGMHSRKGGETLNIPAAEAQIAINVIKNEFPNVITTLDKAVIEAYTTGEVIFNTRSYSRRVFQPVKDILSTIDVSRYPQRVIIDYVKSKLSFSEQADIEGAARNCKVQGTQANMIKEAMVEIYKYRNEPNIEAKLLLSVHDETVTQHKNREFGEVIGRIMTDKANKYLSLYSSNIKMTVSGHTGYSWTK